MTIAIMMVVVLSSVLFDIQPLTAIMIVALALLDDIPIMTIAYDNVRPAPTPVRWDMHRILVFSGLMGLMATAQSFGLVLFGMEWMNDPAMMARIPLDHAHLQTMLFLQLAAGGHMLLFVVRSRGSIVSPPLPSAPLFLAIVATQIVAVVMCAYGVLVPALPWTLVGIVWGLCPCLDGSHRSREARLYSFRGAAGRRHAADGPHDESAVKHHR
jgi:H+-transporting ATPase